MPAHKRKPNYNGATTIYPDSAFAIGSFQYTDEEGTVHSGLSAPRQLIADKDRWEGETTPEKLEEIIQLDQSVSGITGQVFRRPAGS